MTAIDANTLQNKTDYKNLLTELFSLTQNLSKSHADMLASETGFTRQKTAAMLKVLVDQGLATTFQDWINGDHIGNQLRSLSSCYSLAHQKDYLKI